MITLHDRPMVLKGGALVAAAEGKRENTMAYQILQSHNKSGDMGFLNIRFDALASHDITYVGIVQTARASGMTQFPMPYVLTNCHNSLCAVGGTINEDDHLFGLSAAKKYAGSFVPAHMAVIHQYAREQMALGGGMILGSDSHTRYGALGTMGVGEGGPELVKQLCERTYDVGYPDVIGVYLSGSVVPGVGPQDVALAIIGKVFANGFVKNKVMEFIGPGIDNLSVEFRNGIDVMTTETSCLSSIWRTDEKVRQWYKTHLREQAYKQIAPIDGALYDGIIEVDLSTIKPMIALPFHPSNAYEMDFFIANAGDLLRQVEKEGGQDGILTGKLRGNEVWVDQGIVAGCSGGTYENVMTMAHILQEGDVGNDAFWLSVYPASQPQYLALLKDGAVESLMRAGATLRTAFCGPCFGAGDVPFNGGLSIRHSTRNFPNREGSNPAGGQMAYVALMDARSIAATARSGGKLTPATAVMDEVPQIPEYAYDASVYQKRVYNGWGNAKPEEELVFGPNIADWPEQIALADNAVIKVASAIYDAVTTTDELIPSGETSSYRSNPIKLAQFALSRKDPGYVGRAQQVKDLEDARRAFVKGEGELTQEAKDLLALTGEDALKAAHNTMLGSLVFALKPGDGSAREQAASCQRVLGGCANIAREYATKRYRSNLINWGILPFILEEESMQVQVGDVFVLKGIRQLVSSGEEIIAAKLIRGDEACEVKLSLPQLDEESRRILLAGCLSNDYAGK